MYYGLAVSKAQSSNDVIKLYRKHLKSQQPRKHFFKTFSQALLLFFIV